MTGKKQLTDPSQVPHHMSEREEAEFWSSHEVTKEFLDKTERAAIQELPLRSKSISVRFDEDVLRRLRNLAAQKGKKYQTLLKEFVTERIYEEEKRQRGAYWIADQVACGMSSAASMASLAVKQPEAAVTVQSLTFANPASTTVKAQTNEAQDIVGSKALSGVVTSQYLPLFQSANNSVCSTIKTQNVENVDKFVAYGSD